MVLPAVVAVGTDTDAAEGIAARTAADPACIEHMVLVAGTWAAEGKAFAVDNGVVAHIGLALGSNLECVVETDRPAAAARSIEP